MTDAEAYAEFARQLEAYASFATRTPPDPALYPQYRRELRRITRPHVVTTTWDTLTEDERDERRERFGR